MIAIVILGIGLLGAATMFPIAWTRAREVAEFTDLAACTDAAMGTLRLVTHVTREVDGVPGLVRVGAPTDDVPSSFVGDVGVDIYPPPTGDGLLDVDPWVHALHAENYTADFAWDGNLTTPLPLLGDFNPSDWGTGYPYDPEWHPQFMDPFFGFSPQRFVYVKLQDRVFPSLPPPPDLDVGTPTVAQVQRWIDLMSQRGFCWSVLHRLNFTEALPGVGDPRTFTMYVVTLRRSSAAGRFCRQNIASAPPFMPYPPPASPGTVTAVSPAAGVATEDVMFPVPWRVQIELTDQTDPADGRVSPAGLPATAIANSQGYATNRMVPQMLPRGAYMIDELSGLIWKVARREYDVTSTDVTGSLDRAYLTLDGEIPPSWIKGPPPEGNDDGTVDPGEIRNGQWFDADGNTTVDAGEIRTATIDNDGDGIIEPSELLRTVWVFPPAIEPSRGPDTNPAFIGPQPVVGIEARTMTFTP